MKKRKSAAIEVAAASIGLISPCMSQPCRVELPGAIGKRKENFCGILRHERDGDHAIELFGFPTRTKRWSGQAVHYHIAHFIQFLANTATCRPSTVTTLSSRCSAT